MLNAFRHQRLSHAAPRHSRAAWTGAQRLPASEVIARNNTYQRLSVTRTCSTPSGIRGYRTRRPARGSAVAWGAQRLPASEVIARRCSPTPACASSSAQRLPASEVIARLPRPGARRPERVLNAFRHQRLSHGSYAASPVPRSGCSTPSGIRGYRTSTPTAWAARSSSAQRLPASEVIAPPQWSHSTNRPSCAQRLPASEVIARSTSPCSPRRGPRRAQRLPASEVIAPCRPIDAPELASGHPNSRCHRRSTASNTPGSRSHTVSPWLPPPESPPLVSSSGRDRAFWAGFGRATPALYPHPGRRAHIRHSEMLDRPAVTPPRGRVGPPAIPIARRDDARARCTPRRGAR